MSALSFLLLLPFSHNDPTKDPLSFQKRFFLLKSQSILFSCPLILLSKFSKCKSLPVSYHYYCLYCHLWVKIFLSCFLCFWEEKNWRFLSLIEVQGESESLFREGGLGLLLLFFVFLLLSLSLLFLYITEDKRGKRITIFWIWQSPYVFCLTSSFEQKSSAAFSQHKCIIHNGKIEILLFKKRSKDSRKNAEGRSWWLEVRELKGCVWKKWECSVY